MPQTGTRVSIAELHDAIAAMDPGGAYRQVSYNLTEHNAVTTDRPAITSR